MRCFAFLFLASAFPTHALELSSCQGTSMWITIPVDRVAVDKWLDDSIKPADRNQVVLDKAEDTKHPVMIEWDSFHSCKTLLGLPYPSFNEVATMVPYVRWQNKTGVHFQPWSIVNNMFGSAAMVLTGSQHVTESAGGVQYPTPPAKWSQWTQADGSVLALRDAQVQTFTNSTVLEKTDAAWREMVGLKHTLSVTYDQCPGHGFAWTYGCNTIKWDILEAAKILDGELDTMQTTTNFFPVGIKGGLAQLRKDYPGLQAYAVRSAMTAIIGCPKEQQTIVV